MKECKNRIPNIVFRTLSLLLGLSLAGFLFAGISLAQEESQGQPMKLALADAVKLALEQGITAKKALLDLKEAEVSYKQSKADLLLRPSVLTELSAETSRIVAQRNYEIAKSDLALQVEQAYYDVLKAERALVLAKENLDRAETQLKTAQTKFKLGMVAQVDVIAAEAEVASAEAEESRAEANLSLAKMKFNQLIGRDLSAPAELVTQLTYTPVAVDLQKGLDYALSHRLEIKRAEDTIALREKEVEVNTNDFTPILVQENSKIGLESAKLDLESAKTSIVLEVRQNFENLKNAERQVPIQEKSLTKAKESLRIAQARYDAGVITSMELLDAQRSVYQAETGYLQALFDYNVAVARYYKSLGMSLEERPKADVKAS